MIYNKFTKFSNMYFYSTIIILVIISRLAIIILTPGSYNFPDPLIYRMTGDLVSQGFNPYDFSANREAREAIAAPWLKMFDRLGMTTDMVDFDYYVSGNLPASTWLYAGMDILAGDSAIFWRSILIIGDVGIVLGLVVLANVVGARIDDAWFRIGIIGLGLCYPTLILNGTAIPEDKQIQTALLFAGSAAILVRDTSKNINGFLTGFILSIGVLFKFFSVFIFPIYAAVLFRSSWRYRIISSVTGISFLIIAFANFSPLFIESMALRSVRSSGLVAQHASVWTLLPPALEHHLFILRALTCITLIGLILWRWIKGSLDNLNACAAILVVFASLWLIDGAINRPNIAMMFAAGALLVTSHKIGAKFIIGIIFAQALALAPRFIFNVPLSVCESFATILFLIPYFIIILTINSSFSNNLRKS